MITVPTAFAILFWVWTASEILLQIVTRTTRSRGEIKDRGSLLLLLPAIFSSIWAAIWVGETRGQTMSMGTHWLRIAALALMIAGLAVRWTAIYTLGRSFSTNVAMHATQRLRIHGLYRWLRHPSYTGMLLIFASVGINERNWVSLVIMLVFPTAALLYRIHVEEMALTEAFGDDYVDYCRTTRRLVPGIY